MTTRDARMEEVAGRLWTAAAAGATESGDSLARCERLFTDIEAGLRRWIGAEGYASLLSRSAADVLPVYPALLTIPNLITDESEISSSTAADGAAQRTAVLALLVAMMRQLGGIIGDNLAVRLIEQSGTPSPRGIAGEVPTETTT